MTPIFILVGVCAVVVVMAVSYIVIQSDRNINRSICSCCKKDKGDSKDFRALPYLGARLFCPSCRIKIYK